MKADFVRAATLGAAAGFDMLELHMAHGYLLASFLSPLTNVRTDEYGGSVENRLRYPLQVLRAVRAAWPAARPVSVRISACDWAEGGLSEADVIAIAKALVAAGADILDISSGQTVAMQRPVYGRMWQTPLADMVRNLAAVPTIAVGNIFEADHVNSIIAAGRADLCAIARPHLANPSWTLAEAAAQGYTQQWWPEPYLPAKSQLERAAARAAAPAASRMSDNKALQGRHALVTGGGRGIGASIVRALAAHGAKVSMLGRTAATLEGLAAELRSSGAQTFCATADVAKRESVDAAFAAARTMFGPIEILINNAGQAISAPITKRDDALWERLLAINLSGTYLRHSSGVARHVPRRLRANRQYRQHRRTHRLSLRRRLLRGEARCHRIDACGCKRSRHAQHHRQCGVPGLYGYRSCQRGGRKNICGHRPQARRCAAGHDQIESAGAAGPT